VSIVRTGRHLHARMLRAQYDCFQNASRRILAPSRVAWGWVAGSGGRGAGLEIVVVENWLSTPVLALSVWFLGVYVASANSGSVRRKVAGNGKHLSYVFVS
jgi:hypothetical protein